MPRGEVKPHRFDHSDDLRAGRADVQGACHFFLDSLFAGCTVLDVGAGLGQAKCRIRHNRVTSYDPDARLSRFVDSTEMPDGPFDIVAAFDVLEHVEDDVGFLASLNARATRAVFVSTPNWSARGRVGNYHVREYTGAELQNLALRVWDPTSLLLFAHFKDRWGEWFDPVPNGRWDQHMGTKHALLVLRDADDIRRVETFFAGRWGTASQPAERWVAPLDGDESAPPEMAWTR